MKRKNRYGLSHHPHKPSEANSPTPMRSVRLAKMYERIRHYMLIQSARRVLRRPSFGRHFDRRYTIAESLWIILFVYLAIGLIVYLCY